MVVAMPKLANAELVTAAYVRLIVGQYDTAVGATLQSPDSDGVIQWARTGFVQFSVISDPINPNIPTRHTVMSLDVWAVNQGSSKKPPWNLAFNLAETIIAAQFDRAVTGVGDTHAVVSLPLDYPDARVMGFEVPSGPAKRPSDPADFAHVGMECTIHWHGL